MSLTVWPVFETILSCWAALPSLDMPDLTSYLDLCQIK